MVGRSILSLANKMQLISDAQCNALHLKLSAQALFVSTAAISFAEAILCTSHTDPGELKNMRNSITLEFMQ